MKVKILKSNNRFELQCPYNSKVIKVIKNIQNRHYNKNTKTWNLPLEEYQSIRDALPEFEFEVIVYFCYF